MREEGTTRLPLGVTGNTPDSGSGESWFDPRRGNLGRVNRLGWLALFLFQVGPPDWSHSFLVCVNAAPAPVTCPYRSSTARDSRTRNSPTSSLDSARAVRRSGDNDRQEPEAGRITPPRAGRPEAVGTGSPISDRRSGAGEVASLRVLHFYRRVRNVGRKGRHRPGLRVQLGRHSPGSASRNPPVGCGRSVEQRGVSA